jgi:LmbE family N-acetylglucosaminyl deacetylase
VDSKLELDNSIPNSAMVIVAHPDDPDFTCAGTIAKWTAGGCKVTYVLLTSGDVGTDDPHITRQELVAIREAEQTAACAAVGVTDIIFLRHPDCQLVPTLELRREVTGILRKVRPDVVICGDPTALFFGGDYINHPDHRAAAIVALDAVFPSVSQRLLWPELGKAHRVCAVYVSSPQEANVLIDISDTIDRKIAALRAHKSQMGDWDPEERIKEWASENGKTAGVAYAERYRRMKINEPEKPADEDVNT